MKPIIGIVGGTGKMGRWFQNFFQSHNLTVLIAGRKTELTPQELAKQSDIIIVSVPIHATASIIKKVAKHMKKDALLTDITSVKIIPLEAMEKAPCATLGMHPLFGPQVTNFSGQTIVFCKKKKHLLVDFLKDLFQTSGISIVEMSAEEHDYQMAYIQALTHATHLLFAKTIVEDTTDLSTKLYTPTFTLHSLVMGRILQQDINLMAGIQLHNPYFVPILDSLIAKGKKLLRVIQNRDRDNFINMFAIEKKLTKNFADLSTFQTNKILQQICAIPPTTLPEKITLSHIPISGKVAFLGPEGTYSHEAAMNVFPKKSYEKKPCKTLLEVFDLVFSKDATFGVVPAENSIEGLIRGILDYLIDFSLLVNGSFELPIHHQLLSEEKKLENVTVVVSHPQALAQCKNWLKENVPHAKLMSVVSTTAAIKKGVKGYAYIASLVAAKLYSIQILAKNIEDDTSNTTRFYVIARQPMKAVGLHAKRTLLFVTVYNRVGILRDILNVFVNHGLNLTKLESRLSPDERWDYYFFIEVDREQNDPSVLASLKELDVYCPVVKVLGVT